MEWRRFDKASLRGVRRDGLMIVTQHNARSWVGVPTEITDRFVVLVNGADKCILYYDQIPNSRYMTLMPPGGVTFGIGAHRLPLED